MPFPPITETIGHIVELRRLAHSIRDRDERARLSRVIRGLRRQLGVGVPKSQAAALLGVSLQALERWVKSGELPTTRKPGHAWQEIDTTALIAVAEEVTVLREQGLSRGLLASAIRNLHDAGRMPLKLRPNPSPRELRYEYLHTTPAQRLRTAAEMAYTGSVLATKAKARKVKVKS